MKYINDFKSYQYLSESVNQEARNFFAKMVTTFASEKGDTVTDRGNLLLFHGTSPKSASAIISSGGFKNYSFFAGDHETAKRYSYTKLSSKQEPVVLEVEINPVALTVVGGYYSLNEPVYLDSTDNVYKPLDMIQK
jgi:hypothetical protein